MDHCASVLLAFPETKEITENYVYHKTAQQHVQKVERLIKENTATFSGLAAQLLEVRFCPRGGFSFAVANQLSSM